MSCQTTGVRWRTCLWISAGWRVLIGAAEAVPFLRKVLAMALPLGFWIRFSIQGSMASDTWSINPWFSLGSSIGHTPSATELDTLASGAITDFDAKVWSNATNGLKLSNAPYCSLTGIKASFYHDNVLTQSATHGITPVAGTGSSIHPPYVALVATLLTSTAGRTNRGRMYMPATALGVSGTTGQQSGNPSAFTTNLASWFNNRAAWGWGTWVLSMDPIVMTQRGGAPSRITTVRMDTKFDTQRGREDKLIPATIASSTVT